jgi:6,7-dimethyl-8-ribityllumazine synthase
MTTASRRLRTAALSGSGFRIALAVSEFNAAITSRLLAGAQACLQRHGVRPHDIGVFRCPGAFELPLTAQAAAESGTWDAVVCLGAVVRGETPHFEYVSLGAAIGVQSVALRFSLPVAFGVLTTDTRKQARDRAGGRHGNKGWDAALAALQMIHLQRSLRPPRKRRRGAKA